MVRNKKVWGLQHVHWFGPLHHTGQYWRNDHYQTLQLSVTNWITWSTNTSLVITLKWSVDVIIIINNMSTNKTTSNILVHNLRYGWIYMYTPTPIITSSITGICDKTDKYSNSNDVTYQISRKCCDENDHQ